MTIHKIVCSPRYTVYSAWEPYAGHATLTYVYDVCLGRVGTRELPAELAALKSMSDERSIRVRAWHEAQYQEAYAAIVAEYPEARDGVRSMGEIEVRS